MGLADGSVRRVLEKNAANLCKNPPANVARSYPAFSISRIRCRRLVAMIRVKSTRKVYSAEELHRLRGSQSQPKLKEAIEEKDGEDAEIVKGMSCESTVT